MYTTCCYCCYCCYFECEFSYEFERCLKQIKCLYIIYHPRCSTSNEFCIKHIYISKKTENNWIVPHIRYYDDEKLLPGKCSWFSSFFDFHSLFALSLFDSVSQFLYRPNACLSNNKKHALCDDRLLHGLGAVFSKSSGSKSKFDLNNGPVPARSRYLTFLGPEYFSQVENGSKK